MRTTLEALDRGAGYIRWAARISGVLVIVVFLFILILAFTNEDGIHAQAVPEIILLMIAIAGVGIAWRWERVGGGLLVASAVALGLSICQSYPIFGPVGLLLVLLIYTPLPLFSGVLFLLSSRGR